MPNKKTKIALIYDFDGTLAPGNMQDHNFIPDIKMKKEKFWSKVKEKTQENDADEILMYMDLMINKANENKIKTNKKSFKDRGKTIKFFDGVTKWFENLEKYFKTTAIIEHYIISSGLKEIIEGTEISKKFKHIFASSFMYDQNDVAIGPAIAINYTAKTQYLFRINKGIFNNHDNKKINQYTPENQRYLPFANMIYIGDGETDIPCMKMIRHQGGHSVIVYKTQTKNLKKKAQEMVNQQRANFYASANYTKSGKLWKTITKIIKKIVLNSELERNN